MFITRKNTNEAVTILILIDGFLQYIRLKQCSFKLHSHNPYFNRWFSAISPKNL